jgi:enoyl-CoA hydratase/carnithine racemase
MPEYSFCEVSREGRILVVMLNRPDVMNSLHRPANLELDAVFDDFGSDPDLWVAIVSGSGEKAFSAGNDLKFAAAGNDTTLPPGGFGGLTARMDLNKPVIAAVNGVAMGGGFELALACDLIVASDNAVFALPEPKVGLAALAGGLLRLPAQIPLKHAMGMILTGRHVKADEADRLGFVNEIVPAGQTLDAARRWAEQILACSPMSVRASKYLAYRGLETPLPTAYREQRTYAPIEALYSSADRIEGPKAFAEKRKPQWMGR